MSQLKKISELLFFEQNTGESLAQSYILTPDFMSIMTDFLT